MSLQDTAPPPARKRDRRSADAGLAALHQAAQRLSDLARGRQKGRTRDLVGLLLAHGARAWRLSLPRASVKLTVATPAGRRAVRLSFD